MHPNCICQCRPFFVLRPLGLCGSSSRYVVFGLPSRDPIAIFLGCFQIFFAFHPMFLSRSSMKFTMPWPRKKQMVFFCAADRAQGMVGPKSRS